MKKSSQPRENSRQRPQRSSGGSGGPWEFKSQSLFPLGSDEALHRVAYRTATGELRFLPI